MVRGYGVSLVADEWAKKLCSLGWDTTIACLRSDETYAGHNLIHVGADATEILALCKKLKVDLVMAQTSPYFEALPAIAMQYPTIAFEHGDPTPSFFKHDRQERENIKQNKIQHVYPNVSRVLASSHFLRHDIEWSTSSVVPLGCNHVDDFGPKTFSSTSHLLPLQIGTLMRLGEGESLYKGVEIFADIAKFFQEDPKFEFHIMGKGEENDRTRWEALGVRAILNANDEERSKYLRKLDVLVSPSLWEGFNLPLVEAAASGTVGVAFDIGAHPETTPFVVRDPNDLRELLLSWSNDRALLFKASHDAYLFAREKFNWEESSQLLSQHLDEVFRLFIPHRHRPDFFLLRALRALSREGIRGFVRLFLFKVSRKVRRLLRFSQ